MAARGTSGHANKTCDAGELTRCEIYPVTGHTQKKGRVWRSAPKWRRSRRMSNKSAANVARRRHPARQRRVSSHPRTKDGSEPGRRGVGSPLKNTAAGCLARVRAANYADSPFERILMDVSAADRRERRAARCRAGSALCAYLRRLAPPLGRLMTIDGPATGTEEGPIAASAASGRTGGVATPRYTHRARWGELCDSGSGQSRPL